MKYFLAFDKGQKFKNNERFIKIDLKEINEKLVQDKNLRALCTFTCSFSNERDLKAFLHAKGVIASKDTKYDLIITYVKEFNRSISVPYAQDAKFLNYKNLAEIIYQQSKSTNLIQVIIEHYSNYRHLSSEIYSLRSYLLNPYADYKLYDVIRSLVDKICFRQTSGKRILNFKSLYDLGMLLSKYFSPKENKIESSQNIPDSKPFLSEDNPGYFHLEELKERYEKNKDDQMRLF